jgi:hypothetical protein
MNNPSAMKAIRQQQRLRHQEQRQMMERQFPGLTTNAVDGIPTEKQLTPQQLHQLRQAQNAATMGNVNVSLCFIWQFLYRKEKPRHLLTLLPRRTTRKPS